MRRKIILTLAVLTGLLVTAALVTASIWPVINDVETGKTPQYPKLLPQYFSADMPRVFAEASASVRALDRFTTVSEDAEAGVIEATRESHIGFVDDVTIHVRPQTDFVTSVSVHSRSRVGIGDFGQNARNIRAFQAELDRRLGAVRFNPYEKKSEDP